MSTEHRGYSCPVCWHRESVRVQRNGGERGPAPAMEYCSLRELWKCHKCGLMLTQYEVEVLLDAVLTAGEYISGPAGLDDGDN